MSDAKIVPFGKYKGQPIETLLHDDGYREWLLAQPWFRERFKGIYTVILNFGAEPSETPEHNALQVMFLNDNWREKTVLAFCDGAHEASKSFQRHVRHALQGTFETCKRYGSVFIQSLEGRGNCSYDFSNAICDGTLEEVSLGIDASSDDGEELRFMSFGDSSFEADGVDVRFEARIDWMFYFRWTPKAGRSDPGKGYLRNSWTRSLRVEIKPSLGDEFPAVLRQMKNTGCNVLLIAGYKGLGASRDEVVSYFDHEGITLLDYTEVEKQDTTAFNDALLALSQTKFSS